MDSVEADGAMPLSRIFGLEPLLVAIGIHYITS